MEVNPTSHIPAKPALRHVVTQNNVPEKRNKILSKWFTLMCIAELLWMYLSGEICLTSDR